MSSEFKSFNFFQIVCILFFFNLLPIADSVKYNLVPTVINDLHPIPTGHLKCPKWIDVLTKPKNPDLMVITKNIGEIHQTLPVTMCTKMKMITSCYVTFYFKSEVIHKIEPVEITEEECLNTIKDNLRTKSNIPDFPPESCLYLATQENAEFFIKRTSLSLSYDPFSDQFVHPLLKDQPYSFKTRFFKTIHPQSIIYVDTPINVCKFVLRKTFATEESGKLSLYTESSLITSNGSGFVRPICQTNICGRTGYLTSSGEWLEIPDNIRGRPTHHCQESDKSSFRFLTEHEYEKLDKIEREEVMREDLCKITLSQLKKTQLVAQSDLQLFHPSTPGRHPIYVLNDKGVVEMGWAIYKISNSSQLSEEVIKKIQSKTTHNRTYNGLHTKMINGIEFLNPHESFNPTDPILSWETVHPIINDMIISSDDIPAHLIPLEYNQSTVSFLSTLERSISSYWNNILSIFSNGVVFVIFVVFCTLIFCCWISCCWRVIPTKTSEEFEMLPK